MSVDNKGDLRIVGWSINLSWSDGKENVLVNIPDDIAGMIDEYLTEVEDEVNDN